MSQVLATSTLWWREVQRFLRQPSRVVGTVSTPLLFWAVIGTGLSSSFQLPGGPQELSYLEYFFPGTVLILVLFGTIFSTFSVIEDRSEGFLQGVLVAPVARGAVVAGKVLGGATLAWLQGILVLALAPVAGISLNPGSTVRAAGVLALVAIAMTAMGFALAWRIDSTQGVHAVMSLILLPMWFLSGALFPISGAPLWLEWIMRLNPLTYGTAALRRVLYDDSAALADLPSVALSLAVVAIWAVVFYILDLWVVSRTEVR